MTNREQRQVLKSWVKRLLGRPQPTRGEILAARERLATRAPMSPRDPLLARGYCCETGCLHCPWGHRGRD